jgi:hypothetical protein
MDFESAMKVGAVYDFEQWRGGVLIDTWSDHNIIPTEGLNHILSVACANGSQVSVWYVGLFEGNYTPIAGNVMSTFAATANECDAYTEGARPSWTESTPSAGSTTNSANKAVFTMNASKTLYGAFLSSNAVIDSTTGVLLSASRFSTAKAVDSGDELRVTVTLTITSS